MTKVSELRGHLFSVTLSDGTNLSLQSGETVTIKGDLVSDALLEAERLGIVSLTYVTETKSAKEKSGGANK